MATEPARASADWLALREPADAAARDAGLVEALGAQLPTRRPVEVRDLGCGTGSMTRWLAPRLPGPQHWVSYDRDAELLPRVGADPPSAAADGSRVGVETRQRDITRLDPGELSGASLVTASALLDMMTRPELRRFVDTCAAPGCAVLITLSVTGRVELDPADPLDSRVAEAFNAHQRRAAEEGPRLGPDAVDAAAAAFAGQDREVVVRPSPWRVGPAHRELAEAWFTGWLAAAVEQQPDLAPATDSYAVRRRAELAAGALSVMVHHEDLLVLPPPLGSR